MDNDDAIVQVLSDHEHVIDCIVWAPVEACRTIEGANYSNFGGQEDSKDGNEEQVNGDANEEGTNQLEVEPTSSAAGGNAGDARTEDESRATATTRLTTKERIQ
jgi:hypothetical protein